MCSVSICLSSRVGISLVRFSYDPSIASLPAISVFRRYRLVDRSCSLRHGANGWCVTPDGRAPGERAPTRHPCSMAYSLACVAGELRCWRASPVLSLQFSLLPCWQLGRSVDQRISSVQLKCKLDRCWQVRANKLLFIDATIMSQLLQERWPSFSYRKLGL